MLLPTMTSPQGFGKRHVVMIILVLAGVYVFFTTSLWTTVQSPFSSGKDDLVTTEARPIRDQIASIRPSDSLVHSRTLGIADKVYVVALKRATERVRNMTALAIALDLDFTFVDATDARDAKDVLLLDRLIDRVRWQRPRLDDREPAPSEIPIPDETKSDTFIYDAFPFAWSSDSLTHHVEDAPLGTRGADHWWLEPLNEDWQTDHPMEAYPGDLELTPEGRPKVLNAVRENMIHRTEFLTRGIVGCAHSHVKVLREIVEKGLRSAIVLEDDVDIEWDIERILRMQWDALPNTWDIVYLGHCWSATDNLQPSLPHAPSIHKTMHTLCTHGYAVSSKGAKLITRYIRSPDYAFSRPIDQMLKDLVQMGRLESYTVVPAVVVQTKRTASEVGLGGDVNAAWEETSGERLMDSTLERIGMWVEETGMWPGE